MQERILKMQEACKKKQQELAELDRLKPAREDSMRCLAASQNEERFKHIIQQVPLRFRDKTFADYHADNEAQTRVKQIVMRFVETFTERLQDGTPMIFSGLPGTGKTYLSLVMLQALAKAGCYVRYEPSLQFLRVFREKNFESSVNFANHMKSYQQMQFLIIDEVAESRVTGNDLCAWEKEMLFTLIDTRYRQGNLCTLVISNSSKTELVSRLGERIMRRLTEKGISLAFNWPSYYQEQGI